MSVARALAASMICASVLAGGAWAQPYPDRPVTMLVAFPPGGAGGTIAAAKAARAEPDGYTILLHQDALAAGMTLYPNRTFDAEKNFVTIGLVNIAAATFAGRPTLPPNNFNDLLRWMKQPGQSIKVGHPGVGSFGHLADVLLMQELGINVVQVPYRGAGPALVDLLSGQVDLSQISAVVAGPLVNTGQLKAYAIIGRKRFAGLPSVPTMGELGYGKLDIDFWHMLLAPAGTPRPIVDKLNSALRVALADANVNKTFAEGGMDRYAQDEETPEAASALLKREIKLWGDVIRANHIAAQ